MIAAWMLTYLAIGALLLVVARAAEHVVAARGLPRRGVWAGAMVAMVVLPAVYRPVPSSLAFGAALTPSVAPGVRNASPRAQVQDASDAADGAAATGPLGTTRIVRRVNTTPPRATLVFEVSRAVSGNVVVLGEDSSLARFDRALLALWGVLAALAGIAVTVATARLVRARRRWTCADAATRDAVACEAGRRVPVWIAPDTGPAAFGVRTPQVVLPAWFSELADGERALLLAHEAAHVRAADPRLLAAGLAAVVLAPWHLPLVVAYRRLCRAVEHDCDARVLAQHRDVRGYGRLLVRTAEWLLDGRGSWRRGVAARWILAPVPAFAAPASELEGRLRALVRRPPTWRTRLGVVAACTLGGAATVAACAVPSPATGRTSHELAVTTTPVLDSLERWRTLDRGTLAAARVAGRMRILQDSLALVAARRSIPTFDELARGFDTANVWLVVDAAYRPVDHAVTMQRHAYRWETEPTDGREGSGRRQRAARPTTPGDRLSTNVFSFGRAFPLVDARRIDETGAFATTTPTGIVRVHWGRLRPGDSTEIDVLRARGDSLRVPAWFRTVARRMAGTDVAAELSFQRALDTGLRANVATFRPEFLERGASGDPYVWFVLGPDGTAIAHATGREGLGVKRAAWAGDRPLPRAGAAAAESVLTIDGEAWRAKFPGLALRPVSYGWSTMTLGGREVNVLWALTDLSLALGRPAPRAAPAARPPRGIATSFGEVLRDEALMARHLDEAVRSVLPRDASSARRGHRFVWLVFDGDGRTIAADTGRAGLGRRTGGWRDFLPILPRATDTTPRDDLFVDEWSFPTRFPRLRFTNGYHWQGMSDPHGLTVLWAIATPA